VIWVLFKEVNMFTLIIVFTTAIIAVIGAKLAFDGGSDAIKSWKQTSVWKVMSWSHGYARQGTLAHAVGTTLLFVLDLAICGTIVILGAKFFGVMVGGLLGGIVGLFLSYKFRVVRRSLGKQEEKKE
jgi:hypothetical protein